MYVVVGRALVTALKAAFPTARIATDLPEALETVLPVIQPTRFGGADLVPTLDAATVDLDVWAADLSAADDLAAQVRQWVRYQLPGTTITDGTTSGVVNRTATISAPARRPSGNPAVWRVGGAYQITVHAH